MIPNHKNNVREIHKSMEYCFPFRSTIKIIITTNTIRLFVLPLKLLSYKLRLTMGTSKMIWMVLFGSTCHNFPSNYGLFTSSAKESLRFVVMLLTNEGSILQGEKIPSKRLLTLGTNKASLMEEEFSLNVYGLTKDRLLTTSTLRSEFVIITNLAISQSIRSFSNLSVFARKILLTRVAA